MSDTSRQERRHDGDLYQTIGRLTEAVQSLKGDIAELKSKVEHIEAMANKYRGMLLAVFALGGAAAWVVDRLPAWMQR